MEVVGLISKVSPYQSILCTYCLTAKLLFKIEGKKLKKILQPSTGLHDLQLAKSIRRQAFSNQIVSFTTAQQPERAL